MTKNIQRRLEKIEQTLSIGKKAHKQTCVILRFSRFGSDKTLIDSLGPIDQWASYGQYKELHKEESIIVFQADPQLEVIARQRPLTPDELAVFDDFKFKPCVA